MSIMDTGFCSEAQESYLRINEPELYKAVLKKHGSFNKAKKRVGTPLPTSNTPNIPRGRRRNGREL